eukprot:m51a1_g388 hypothetical protein (144) ;mRNA; f:692045-693870
MDDVVRKIQRVLETLSPLPVTPRYVGVAVPQAACRTLRKQCKDAAQRAGLPHACKWYLYHLTVAFQSPQPDELVRAHWSRALRLLGTRLTVTCTDLVVSARSQGIAVLGRGSAQFGPGSTHSPTGVGQNGTQDLLSGACSSRA